MAEIVVKRRRLHPGQATIATSTARFRVVMCGRRFGKTILGITEAQQVAIEGGAVWWFAPTYKYAVEPWDDLVHRLRPMAKDVSEQERRLVLLNGGVIDVWTCDHPDPGRGRFYDLVVIDEAGIIAKLDMIW